MDSARAIFPRLRAKLNYNKWKLLVPLKIWEAHIYFAQFLIDEHANANLVAAPLLDKNQTKHELSRTTRVSKTVYFHFVYIRICLPHRC